MKVGTLVRMDLPSQPNYGKFGLVVERRMPQTKDRYDRFADRITYHVLVGDEVLVNQLYEYMVEVIE